MPVTPNTSAAPPARRQQHDELYKQTAAPTFSWDKVDLRPAPTTERQRTAEALARHTLALIAGEVRRGMLIDVTDQEWTVGTRTAQAFGKWKSSGTARLLVDHTASGLNPALITQQEQMPPPQMASLHQLARIVERMREARPHVKLLLSVYDLDKAFRRIPVRDTDTHHLLFRVGQRLLIDRGAPMGLATSPAVMCAISTAMAEAATVEGQATWCAYVDDFIGVIYEDTVEAAEARFETIARDVGMPISRKKRAESGPAATIQRWLGWEHDVEKRQHKVTEERWEKLHNILEGWRHKSKGNWADRKLVAKVGGILTWLSGGFTAGRPFTIHISHAGERKEGHKRTRITRGMREDVNWWIQLIERGQRACSFNIRWKEGDPVATFDASLSGYGYHFSAPGVPARRGAWGLWKGPRRHVPGDMTALELTTAVILLTRNATQWKGKAVWLWGDNAGAMAVLTRGRARAWRLRSIMRRLMLLAAHADMHLTLSWTPTASNSQADWLSRRSEGGSAPSMTHRMRLEKTDVDTRIWW
jgi:hypothetical protein